MRRASFDWCRYRRSRVVISRETSSTGLPGGIAIPHVKFKALKNIVCLFARLEELFLGRRITAVRKRLERLNPTTQPEEYDALFEKLGDRRPGALAGERERLGRTPDAECIDFYNAVKHPAWSL